MAQIAGAHAKHVGTHPGEIWARRRWRDHQERTSRVAVYTGRRERGGRREMSDDRYGGRVVRELLRDPDGYIPTAAVVHDAQRQRPSPNSAPGVDFLDRKLRGMLHRYAAGLRKGSGEPEDNGFPAASTGAGSKRANRGEEGPAPAHERARLRLRMG